MNHEAHHHGDSINHVISLWIFSITVIVYGREKLKPVYVYYTSLHLPPSHQQQQLTKNQKVRSENSSCQGCFPFAGLWIRITFLRIRIQLFISMPIRIRIQQPFKCGSGSSLTNIFNKWPVLCEELKKTQNIAQKLKTMELVQIYLIFKNKITISTNFLECF